MQNCGGQNCAMLGRCAADDISLLPLISLCEERPAGGATRRSAMQIPCNEFFASTHPSASLAAGLSDIPSSAAATLFAELQYQASSNNYKALRISGQFY